MSTAARAPALAVADGFLAFVNASPTPFHAVKNASIKLEKNGFKLIKERDPWSSTLQPGGKYYLTRNGSTIVAFAVGKKWKSGNPIAIVGAHTDSPCLRLKPVSKKQSDGYLQVGVETYGGGLWHTWFDRDLSLAGRVMVREKDGTVAQKLVNVEKPIVRIPTLAVHLERTQDFKFNLETQLFPIAGLVAAELERQGGSPEDEKKDDGEDLKPNVADDFQPLKPMKERHHEYIIDLVAERIEVTPEQIIDFELVLYDTQKSCIGGLNDELIYSARLDNLMMTHCAIEGFVASLQSGLDTDHTIRLVACFDHEEIGSRTAQGADSNMLPAVIRRLSLLPGNGASSPTSETSFEKLSLKDVDSSTAYEQTLIRSFLISADMAHAFHPNYAQKYESSHKPEMNQGTVVKVNANNRYATNSPGLVLIQEVAKKAKKSSISKSKSSTGVPLQMIVVRNDSSCGSTIGPMMSAKLGMRTLDLGNPQLSMHSIRETCGAQDVEHAINLIESFYVHYGDLEKTILVD